jgi:O-antigen ligase
VTRVGSFSERWSAARWGLLALVIAAISAALVVMAPIAALVIVACTVALVGAVVTPGLLFAAYLLVSFYKASVQPFSPVDITVLLALLNALQIVPVVLDRRQRSISTRGLTLFVALAALVLAGALYAPDQNLALNHVATYWALVFLPIVPAAMRVGSNPRYLREFLWAFFGMGIVTVTLGLTQLSSDQRLVVLGQNTIQTARAALLAPLIGVTFVLQERGLIGRAIAVVLIPPAVVIALASGSRGPLLALVVLALFTAARRLSRPRTVNWRVAGIGLAVTLASIVVVSSAASSLPSEATRRFGSLADFVQSMVSEDPTVATGGSVAGETSAGARVAFFGVAISLFEERPLLGMGTAGFGASSRRFLGYTELYPHNAVLQFAAEYGLVGLAIFAGLTYLAVTRRLGSEKSHGAARVLFLFFFLNAMVSGDIFSDRETWGLLMLLLLIDLPHVVQWPAGGPSARSASRGHGHDRPDLASTRSGASVAVDPHAALTCPPPPAVCTC